MRAIRCPTPFATRETGLSKVAVKLLKRGHRDEVLRRWPRGACESIPLRSVRSCDLPGERSRCGALTNAIERHAGAYQAIAPEAAVSLSQMRDRPPSPSWVSRVGQRILGSTHWNIRQKLAKALGLFSVQVAAALNMEQQRLEYGIGCQRVA